LLSLFFNYWAGKLYDEETAAGSIDCVGPRCYRGAFGLSAGAAALALLHTAAVVPYTRRPKGKALAAPLLGEKERY